MEGKNRKLREQFATEARSGADEVGDKSSRTLLRGISIHVNGFTKPSHQASAAASFRADRLHQSVALWSASP